MNCVITSKGAELLRTAAENSDKVVFTRAVASSNFDKDRSDLCSVPLSWFNGIDGSIDAVSAGVVDASGNIPNDAGLSVVSYESGTLTVKLADGTVLEIAATEAE